MLLEAAMQMSINPSVRCRLQPCASDPSRIVLDIAGLQDNSAVLEADLDLAATLLHLHFPGVRLKSFHFVGMGACMFVGFL